VPEPFKKSLPNSAAIRVREPVVAIEHEDVAVAIAVRPAFDRRVGRDGVGTGVALVCVRECHGHLLLRAGHDDVREADGRMRAELRSTGAFEMS
jgi:hypothetical protein